MAEFGINCEYDAFHNRLAIDGKSIEGCSGKLNDYIYSIIRHVIVEKFQFDPGKANVRDVTEALCIQSTYDPILDFLDGLKWDLQPRLKRLLTTYFGAEDTPLNRAIGTIVLIAAVRRIREPGCKFDTMLVLEGPQGSGKSTALRILAGDANFSDQDLLAQDAKTQVENLEGIWIYEISELQGMSKAEVNKIKSFISRQEDRARPAYGRFREDRPRRGIFVGTTNDSEYLRDPTGNRRFLPVVTGLINLEALARDRDQLWAEAAQREATGESIVLPQELWGDAAEEQEKRLETDPWESALAHLNDGVLAYFNGNEERISTEVLLEKVLQIQPKDQHSGHYKRLATSMRRLGWDGPKNIREGGKVFRGYERKKVAQSEQTQLPFDFSKK